MPWPGPAVVVEPTRRHLHLLRGLLSAAGTTGNLVSDTHLAAIALEHDATVVSFDRDFARFGALALGFRDETGVGLRPDAGR